MKPDERERLEREEQQRDAYTHLVDDDEDCGIDLAVEEDDGTPPPPPTRWQTASELTGGLVALLLVSVGVFALYVAGGVFLGLLTWAAPAIAVMAAALLFARYLSRR